MIRKKSGIGAKFKYGFDNFMSKGGISVFTALMSLFIGAMILMAIIRFIANLIMPQENMSNLLAQWWRAFLQISDGGSIAEDSDSNIINKAVGIISLFAGLVLFSSLVAFITNQFEQMMTNLRKGKSNIIEKDHTIILGFGDRVLEIIRELIIANESEKNPAVVVLAEKEKDELDDFFNDRIENHKTTRIVTRSGSTSSVHLLQRISIHTAKSVIILNDSPNDAADEIKALSDARVLKTILAVITCTGDKNHPPIIAELHSKSKQKLALNISDKISVIDDSSILAKLMVQTSRISGLAQVYDNLVGFEGNEFYFYKPNDGWDNKTFGELIFHFAGCCPLGIKKEDGTININPDKKTKLSDNDHLVILAEDDSTIKCLKHQLKINTPDARPATPQPKVIERQLLVGWNRKASAVIDEYTEYLLKGSSIDLLICDPPEEIINEVNEISSKHKDIKINILNKDLENPDVLVKLKPENYDNVIILSSDSGEAELRDSGTIAKLLQFRHYFKKIKQNNIRTKLITEVADSENIEVIQETGVKDFLISNQFISKIYAQVSQEPQTLKIYDDLFSEEGSEVYIKPVKLYLNNLPAKVSFGELCAAALLRNETCFGVRIAGEEKDEKRHYGIYINPEKKEIFSLNENDSLITLAEDES